MSIQPRWMTPLERMNYSRQLLEELCRVSTIGGASRVEFLSRHCRCCRDFSVRILPGHQKKHTAHSVTNLFPMHQRGCYCLAGLTKVGQRYMYTDEVPLGDWCCEYPTESLCCRPSYQRPLLPQIHSVLTPWVTHQNHCNRYVLQ